MPSGLGNSLTSIALYRPRWTVGGIVVLLVLLAIAMFYEREGAAGSMRAAPPMPRQACGLWDEQASAAIADRVRDSKRDDELRRLADGIFRLRRARRNCAEGWVDVACRDYHAIIRTVSDASAARRLFVASSVCSEDPSGSAGQARAPR
jgi:hypothetical protein